MRRLRGDGRRAFAVAIRTPETPEVAAAADTVVDDPGALVALLRRALPGP